MCTVLCVNTKCDKRQENGYCGRAYPCSECQPLIDRKIKEDIMSSGDRTPLKDIAKELHERLGNDCTYGGIPMSNIYKEMDYDTDN